MSILLPTRRALNVGAWAKNSLWKTAKSVPSLDLRFAENKSLVDSVSGQNLITFTRASSGTYVGSDGLIKTAAVGEARFDHNPTTGESLGLLVEESRTNLLLRSEEFNTSWIVSGGIAVTENAIVAPDGNTTADSIAYPSVSSGYFIAYQRPNVTNATFTFSVYLKGATGNEIVWIMGTPDGVTYASKQCQLTTSWQRFSVSTSVGSTSCYWQIGVDLRDAAQFSRPAQTIYAWGAQLEQGSFPTSYIPTTSSQATRSADVASITGANFTRWFNSSAFTVYGDAIGYNAATTVTNSGSGYPYIYSLHSVNTNRLIGSRAAGGTNNGAWSIYSSPPNQFGYTTGANFNTVQKHKVGGAYSSSEYLAFADGAIGTSVAPSATTTSFTTLLVGSGTDGGYWGGTISRLTYWRSRLPNSILQDLTQ